MRHPLIFVVALAAFAVGAEKPEGVDVTKEVKSIKTIDPDELGDQLPVFEGKIVKLKFNYRLGDVDKQADGSMKGRVGIYRSSLDGRRFAYGYAAVHVPAEAKDWFLKLTTSDTSRGTIYAFGRVEKSGESSSTVVKLLGRELRTDMKGSRIFW